jgi:divinyl protochlorophyllide a 8-vinyl-reductase
MTAATAEHAARPAPGAAGGARTGAPAAAHIHGRIGPNAITRVAEALLEEVGAAARAELFGRAGLTDYLRDPPQQMVAEEEVIGLHEVLRAQLPVDQARRVNRDAGARTGAYLLGNRIPRPVQVLLRALPAPLAARLLVSAIRRHAWTFAGTAHFSARGARPVGFTLAGCPLCRGAHASGPCCDFYAACFEHLFRALVHRHATVRETTCTAAGDAACHFDVRW